MYQTTLNGFKSNLQDPILLSNVSVELEFLGEQPTVRINSDGDIDHLHRETNVIGRGEATQTPQRGDEIIWNKSTRQSTTEKSESNRLRMTPFGVCEIFVSLISIYV